MLIRTLFFSVALAAGGLFGAAARADDLPANGWVPMIEVVVSMERVGFSPIAKIEAKDGNWMVHAYRRSVLYEVQVDPHANAIKSVSAKSVTACGGGVVEAAAAPLPGEKDRIGPPTGEPADSKRETAESGTAKSDLANSDPAPAEVSSLAPSAPTKPPGTEMPSAPLPPRKPAAVGKSARVAPRRTRSPAPVIGTPRPIMWIAPPSPRRLVPHLTPSPRGLPRGYLGASSQYHWYR